MYEVKSLGMVSEMMARMGYSKPEADGEEWADFTVRFIDFLRTEKRDSLRKAVFLSDLIILSFPKLYHNIEKREWHIPTKENPLIYWGLSDDEIKVFIATFIKATIPVLYSASLTNTTFETLRQDVRILIDGSEVNPKGYFVFKNGVLDIKTRTLQTSADGIFTRQLPYEYVEDDVEAISRADALIGSFVYKGWSIEEQEKTKKLLYECLLYGCQPKHTAKKVFVFFGDSNTGKSTFPKIWDKLLGQRYMLVPEDADRKINDQFFLYAIHQSQILHMDEVNGRSRKLRDFIKAMSTPQNNTAVRVPGGTTKQTDISVLMTFTTNHVFKFKESSKAMWNRLLPIHFAQVQTVSRDWDIDTILTDRLQADIVTAMMHYTKTWGNQTSNRECGWTLPIETIKLREAFCESDDDEYKLFRPMLAQGNNWMRTSDIMDKLNTIIISHNMLLPNKEDTIELFTRLTFELRLQRLLAKLNIKAIKEQSPIEITHPDNKKNKKTLLASGWTGIKFIDNSNSRVLNDWERMENGMLDPDDVIKDTEDNPFQSLF
jgi:hypothetical protein